MQIRSYIVFRREAANNIPDSVIFRARTTRAGKFDGQDGFEDGPSLECSSKEKSQTLPGIFHSHFKYMNF
jgi:hypothetical protein